MRTREPENCGRPGRSQGRERGVASPALCSIPVLLLVEKFLTLMRLLMMEEARGHLAPRKINLPPSVPHITCRCIDANRKTLCSSISLRHESSKTPHHAKEQSGRILPTNPPNRILQAHKSSPADAPLIYLWVGWSTFLPTYLTMGRSTYRPT